MSSQMSHRAPPRDRATESLVREAALTLFAQRGYHGTSPLSSWTTGQIISVSGGYAMP